MMRININIAVFLCFICLFTPEMTMAVENHAPVDILTDHWAGYAALITFIVAYVAVILEERTQMRKSKPVIVAAGIIWTLIAIAYYKEAPEYVEQEIRRNLLDFGELFLFLLAAMTYINTMDERGIFIGIRAWLVSRGFSLRAVFWLTGLLAFFISPFADNLTTALLMATVVLAVGGDNRAFVIVACINVVVAANAGGAFSPFGDITTLMVWQKDILEFEEFFVLFVPSLVNWLVPAGLMSLTIPEGRPKSLNQTTILRHGAIVVVGLFLLTIIMAVCGHNFLHMPPVLGMMTGLGLLKMYGYYLTNRDMRMMSRVDWARRGILPADFGGENLAVVETQRKVFNIFVSLKRVEWDTLMFFYGVIMCVGGLGTAGYLAMVSESLYGVIGATISNILIGILSAILDNIPLMFAVISMNPEMSQGQWLLVTLTVGVGGSLLSIGSAAGVAVMGQARGIYTFFAHLKWIWAIALGYAASIWVHFLLNAASFSVNTVPG